MRRQDLQVFENTAYIAERIPNLGITRAIGVGAPTNGAVGYAIGCIWQDAKTAWAELTSFYINTGTLASATWTAGNEMAGLLATVAEINRNNKVSTRLVASGSSLTITQLLHDGKTIVLAAAAAITLPAMAGTGARYRFVLPQDATAVTITATGAHLFGALNQNNDTTQGTGFQLPAINAGGSTTITLNGTTQGGRKGDWIEIEDIATSVGTIRGQLNASGSEVTPFS